MTEEQRREVVAKTQHWADLFELLRLHRGLVRSFYQNSGRVVQEQFRLKQLHFSSQPGVPKLMVG